MRGSKLLTILVLASMMLSFFLFFSGEVEAQEIDYIQLRTAPGGGGINLCDPGNYLSVPLGYVTTFYGAAYNSSSGYIGDVNISSMWNSSDPLIVSVTNPGNSSTITCSDTNWGTVTITLDDGEGHMNTTQVTVLPSVDYIQIRDAAGGAGNIVTTATYSVWETDVFYAAAYNLSVGYLYDASADWDSDDPGVGQVTTPGTSTTFTAQQVATDSPCTVTADYGGGVTNSTGLLTVLAPRTDYVQIRTAPGGGGIDLCDPANYPSYPMGDITTFYGAAYNLTIGYISDVNSSSTWISSNSTIVSVTNPGSSTTITCSDTNWGTATVTLSDVVGPINTTQVTVLQPTIDFILLTNAPNGTELTTVVLNFTEQVTAYASGYNYTSGYVGLTLVEWSQWPELGWFDNSTGTSTTFTAGYEGGSTTITGWQPSLGINDSFEVIINPPETDFILLTDSPNGIEIEDRPWYIGIPLLIYASGYNSTASNGSTVYIGLVEVSWADNPDLGDFDNPVGTSSTFTGTSEGLTTIKGENGTLNDTFQLDLVQPPDYINITDAPNGTALTTVFLNVTEQVTAYASGYNFTSGYVGLAVVDWSQWPSLGSFDNLTGTSTTFTAGDEGGSTTITGWQPNLGMNDSFEVIINPPETDSILLTESPNGIEIEDMPWYIGDPILIYASGYNTTIGNASPVYVGLVNVSWADSPDLGDFNNLTGTSSTFTGTSEGQTTLKGENGTLNDTFQLNLIIPTAELDYIIITDTPNGVPLDNVTLPVGGHIKAYASGYNTSGFVELVSVNWSHFPVLGSLDNLTGTSTTFTAGVTGGLTTVIGENITLGLNDTFNINITIATVDYIQIRDAPSGGGVVILSLTLDVGQLYTLWAAAYNFSSGYLGDFTSTTWDETSGGSVITVTTPGASTFVQAQLIGGISIIIADFNSTQNTTSVTVNPPTADYIQIRTQLGGGGANLCDPANYKSYPVGTSDTFYGAMYNHTAGYFAAVPSTATWVSSNTSIVTVTSPGSSSNVVCDDQNWGTVTITISTSVKQNTTQVTVLDPDVDYIRIRDEPDGLGNIVLERTYIVWQTDEFYAAGYNNTAGYLGEVEATWLCNDTSVGSVTSPGYWTTFIAQKVNEDSICYVTAEYNGIQNSTSNLTVLAPIVDYIVIVDLSNGNGSWVTDRTYDEGDNDTFWAAGYNLTADYVNDVKATWESNNTVVGNVTSGPNEYTNFSTRWKGGYCRVTATYDSLVNHTGPLFVINLNQLPTAIAKYHNGTGFQGGDYSFAINLTLRVAGRKQNVITMELEEDGVIVNGITVTRNSNQPDIGMISYEMDANCVYEIVLSYEGNNGGSNPVIVTFEFLGNIYSVHLLFNSQHGIEQKARIEFNDICKLVGVVFFDGFYSLDFDGYLTEYEWDFGDGFTEGGETLAHVYETNGIYTVTLTVTDDEGGVDTSTITVTIEDIDNNDQANAIPGQQESKGYLNASGQYVVILQCPADLLITNFEGQRIGFLNSSQINNIVGAFTAMLFSDVEVYFIPMGEIYTLEVFGTGEGFYDLSVIGVKNDITKKYSVSDVPCSESTLDTYIFNFEEESISLSTNEDDKRYSMEFHTSIEDNWDSFNLTDMGLNTNATHIYKVNNWEGLSSGKPVSLSIDEESDGLIDRSIALETGLTGEDIDVLLIKSPLIEPAFPFLLFFIVGSILAISIGSFLTEVGKWALLMLFLPLYSRIKKEELLNQPTRYKIHGYLIGNPGAHFGLIKQDLGIPNGQLAYHLRQMMKGQIIYSKEDGIRKRFYPVDFPKSKGSEHFFSDIQEKILVVVKKNSGISQKRVASSMGISRQVAGYHLTKMEEIGLIKKERVGRESKYYPHEKYSV